MCRCLKPKVWIPGSFQIQLHTWPPSTPQPGTQTASVSHGGATLPQWLGEPARVREKRDINTQRRCIYQIHADIYAIFISTSIWDLIWLTLLLLLLPLMLILWPHLTGSGLTSGTGRQVSLLRKIKMIHFMLMRTSAKYVEERAATRATRPYLFFTSEQEVWNTRRRRLNPSYPAGAAGARGASTQLGKYSAG